MSDYTLSSALDKALDPCHKAEGLRLMLDFIIVKLPETTEGVRTEHLPFACASALLVFGLGGAANMAPRIPEVVGVLTRYERLGSADLVTIVKAGWDLPHTPRSADWVDAARRLAAWADEGVKA